MISYLKLFFIVLLPIQILIGNDITSISRIIFIYNTGRWVSANKKDGIAEIDLPFSQHQAPVTRGFLFVGGWVDFNMYNENYN